MFVRFNQYATFREADIASQQESSTPNPPQPPTNSPPQPNPPVDPADDKQEIDQIVKMATEKITAVFGKLKAEQAKRAKEEADAASDIVKPYPASKTPSPITDENREKAAGAIDGAIKKRIDKGMSPDEAKQNALDALISNMNAKWGDVGAANFKEVQQQFQKMQKWMSSQNPPIALVKDAVPLYNPPPILRDFFLRKGIKEKFLTPKVTATEWVDILLGEAKKDPTVVDFGKMIEEVETEVIGIVTQTINNVMALIGGELGKNIGKGMAQANDDDSDDDSMLNRPLKPEDDNKADWNLKLLTDLIRTFKDQDPKVYFRDANNKTWLPLTLNRPSDAVAAIEHLRSNRIVQLRVPGEDKPIAAFDITNTDQIERIRDAAIKSGSLGRPRLMRSKIDQQAARTAAEKEAQLAQGGPTTKPIGHSPDALPTIPVANRDLPQGVKKMPKKFKVPGFNT